MRLRTAVYGPFSGQDHLVVFEVLPEEDRGVQLVRAFGLAEAAVDTVVDFAHLGNPFIGEELRTRISSDELYHECAVL